jgi:hypothetical protein
VTNAEHAAKIAKMTERQLLLEVLTFPEGMTDGYYGYFRRAVEARAVALGLYSTALTTP